MGPVTLAGVAIADPQDLIELGVLLKAKAQGLIPSFGQAVARMQANGIYYHPALVAKLCRLAGESS